MEETSQLSMLSSLVLPVVGGLVPAQFLVACCCSSCLWAGGFTTGLVHLGSFCCGSVLCFVVVSWSVGLSSMVHVGSFGAVLGSAFLSMVLSLFVFLCACLLVGIGVGLVLLYVVLVLWCWCYDGLVVCVALLRCFCRLLVSVCLGLVIGVLVIAADPCVSVPQFVFLALVLLLGSVFVHAASPCISAAFGSAASIASCFASCVGSSVAFVLGSRLSSAMVLCLVCLVSMLVGGSVASAGGSCAVCLVASELGVDCSVCRVLLLVLLFMCILVGLCVCLPSCLLASLIAAGIPLITRYAWVVTSVLKCIL